VSYGGQAHAKVDSTRGVHRSGVLVNRRGSREADAARWKADASVIDFIF
jgi:hypothetical protein